MGILQLSTGTDNIVGVIQRLIMSQDSTNPSMSTADITSMFNEAYIQWKVAVDPMVIEKPGSALATTFASGTKSTTVLGTPLIREFIGCYRETSSSVIAIGPELERMEAYEILELQQSDTTQAAPTRYSVERVANYNAEPLWLMRVHPIPDSTYYVSARVKVHPTALANSTDAPDVNDEESWMLCRVAAARIARLIGRSDAYVDDLWRGVSERMQAVLRVQSETLKPRIYAGETG